MTTTMFRRSALVLPFLLVQLACGDGMATPDSGMGDAGADAGTTACGPAHIVMGVAGAASVVSGDTSTVRSQLGGTCWGDTNPTELVAYVVPGTGDVGIEALVDRGEGASENWPAVQIRRACDEPPPGIASCSNNWSLVGGDARAEVGTVARGGETLFFVVTDSLDVSGSWTLRITPTGASAPILTNITTYTDYGVDIVVDGTDADGNAHGVLVTFRDAAGTLLSPEDGYLPSEEGRYFALDEPDELVGETSFRASARFSVEGAATMELRLVDLTRVPSEPMTVNLESGP